MRDEESFCDIQLIGFRLAGMNYTKKKGVYIDKPKMIILADILTVVLVFAYACNFVRHLHELQTACFIGDMIMTFTMASFKYNTVVIKIKTVSRMFQELWDLTIKCE